MSWVKNAASALGKAVFTPIVEAETGGGRDAVAGGSLRPEYLLAIPPADDKDPTSKGIQEENARLFSIYEWVNTCVNRISHSAAMLECSIINRASDESDEDNPAAVRLKIPNPWMTEFELWESTIAWLQLTGNAFWIYDYDATADEGVVPYIYVAAASKMRVIPDKEKWIKGYVLDLGLGDQNPVYAPEEVVHFKMFNPENLYLGIGPVAALRATSMLDLNAIAYNQNFFKQGAQVDGVLEYEGHLQDPDYQRLRKQFQERYHGVAKQHLPIILQGGLSWKQTGVTPRDAEFLRGREMNREAVFGVYGLPPALGGIFRYANYANSKQQYKYYWNETMAPLMRRVEQRVTRDMVWRFGMTDYKAWFDISKAPALQEDDVARTKRLLNSLEDGAITINEFRAEYGYDSLPGGDKTLLEIGVSDPAEVFEDAAENLGGWENMDTADWEAFVSRVTDELAREVA